MAASIGSMKREHIETEDDDASNATRPNIDEEDLQLLKAKIAAKAKYPPGCPVLYDLTTSSKCLDACHGVVKSVYIDVESGDRFFKVERKKSNNETSERLFRPDQLAYATDCPVKVKGTVENEPNKEVEGMIFCPKPGKGGMKTSYSVRFFLEGNHVRVALGVESEQITFREIDKESTTTKTVNKPNKVVANKTSPTAPSDPLKKAPNNNIEGDKKTSTDVTYTSTNGSSKLDPPHPKSRVHGGCNSRNSNENYLLNRPVQPHINNERSRDQPITYKRSSSTALPNVSLHAFERCNSLPESSALQNLAIATKTNRRDVSLNLNHSSFTTNSNKNNQRPPPALQPNVVDPTPLPIVSPKIGHNKTPFLEPSHVPATNQKVTTLDGKWEPPSSDSPRGRDRTDIYCCLKVPLWVTNSNKSSLFFHIIGTRNGEKGHKTHRIESETGCAVDIPNGTPVKITIRPMNPRSHQYDIMKAKIMIEDSLLDFLECSGSRTRLLYELGLYCELAVSVEGASHVQRADSGVVQQRRYGTNELVWMKLLDIPTFQNGDVLSFSRENLQHKVQNETQCSVEVFGQDLNNIQLSVDFCKPFVLICGECREHVGKVTSLVADAINEYRQRFENETQGYSTLTQNASVPKASVSSGKRKPPTDASSLPIQPHEFDSNERPTKVSKVNSNGTQNTEYFACSREATCILTVPLWVVQKCTQGNELFFHLLGYRGQKINEMQKQTKCRIHLSENDITPMTISIVGDFRGVRKGMSLIGESILEFLEDANSGGRLMYEFAMTAKGTYDFRQADGAIRQEWQHSHPLVWMKILELPSAEWKGKLTPHGRYLLHHVVRQQLTDGTGCSVEVFGYNDRIPTFSGPYVLVCGNSSEDVNEVAARVAVEIEQHRQGCPQGCKFFN